MDGSNRSSKRHVSIDCLCSDFSLLMTISQSTRTARPRSSAACLFVNEDGTEDDTRRRPPVAFRAAVVGGRAYRPTPPPT